MDKKKTPISEADIRTIAVNIIKPDHALNGIS